MRTKTITGIARSAFATLLLFVLVPLPAQAAIKIEEVASPGGVKAWLSRDTINPIVSIHVLVRNGGSAFDPKGKEGLARMTAALLDEGAGKLDSQAFQRRIEDKSITLGFNAGLDHLSINLRSLKRNLGDAAELLRLALTAPRFDPEPVTRVRSQTLAILQRRSVSPRAVAGRTWFKTAFAGHAYARPTRGTAASVAAIAKADLAGFMKTRVARDSLVIGVTGDITPEELKPLLDKMFGGLPAKSGKATLTAVAPTKKGSVTVIRRPFPQSFVIFGQRGPRRTDKDYYAVFVMNHILGGGSFSSRLYTEVREKRGLAYSVGSYLRPMDRSGLIVGSVATRNDRVAESIRLIRAEWKRMAEQGVSAEELKLAKQYLTGSYPLRFVNTARIAGTLAWVQMLDLGKDYIAKRNDLIQAVTAADIKRVARTYLDGDPLFFVIVGDPKGVKKG